SAQASIARNVVYVNDLTAALNEKDYIGATGVLALQKPYRYSGSLVVNLADVSTLKPLLEASGNKNQLAGSLVMTWQGEGDAATFKNDGQLKLKLEHGCYANLENLQANVDASYTPDGLDIPIIFLGSDKIDFQAILHAKGSTLEIDKIQIDQGKAKYASGYVSVPFIWKNLGTGRQVMPSDGKVVATVQSENLDIKKLFEDFGAEPVAAGVLNFKLDAQGTVAQLAASFDLQMRELKVLQLSTLEAATVEVS